MIGYALDEIKYWKRWGVKNPYSTTIRWKTSLEEDLEHAQNISHHVTSSIDDASNMPACESNADEPRTHIE
jgi:hypothetical protein